MIKLEVVVILFFRAHKVTIIFHIIGINMPYFMLFNIKYLDIAIFWKPSIVFFVKTLACLKYLRTFAPLLTKSTSEKKFWRGGRVVDCGGLENRCTARYPGFESLSLRWKAAFGLLFCFYGGRRLRCCETKTGAFS